ncbi:MAG: GNAT family N-acetyltransferase [Zoogloeaceae bacterium]|nr:GNAT family N-acetyltransferase [Zoogloeaceae bacterium]
MTDYPQQLVQSHRLRDGADVVIRPIRPEDAEIEQAFVRELSDDSRYNRFMGQLRELPSRKLEYLTEIDYDWHMALIATVQRDGREVEIGVARYVVAPENDGSCEFAVAVGDAWQGTGVADLLMQDLMAAARSRGLKKMIGFVLPTNHRMLKFCYRLGFESHHELGDGDNVSVFKIL